jgi:hypothetical protein
VADSKAQRAVDEPENGAEWDTDESGDYKAVEKAVMLSGKNCNTDKTHDGATDQNFAQRVPGAFFGPLNGWMSEFVHAAA